MSNEELRQTLERYGYSDRHISRMISFLELNDNE